MTKITIIGSEKSGKTTLASKLGKKGTTADITMYDFSKNDKVLTTIDAVGYPTSIKPMVTAFNLSDIVLLCVPPEGLDAHTGECIIALDLLGYKHGIIVLTKADTSYPFALDELKEKLKKVTAGTSLENWEYISISTTSFEGMEELKEMIFDMGDVVAKEQEELNDLPTRVVIDQSFNVTGIGCVVLGIVMQGTLKAKDKLVAFPTDKTIEVRSIQMHDVDTKSAPAGARVGLALKNVQSKDIERGFILSEKEDVTEDLTLKCKFSPFSKGFTIGDVPHIFVGLQSSPMRVEKIEKDDEEVERTTTDGECIVTLLGSKLLAYNESDRFTICNLDDKQRFAGYGYKA